jgi:hypothetical protein
MMVNYLFMGLGIDWFADCLKEHTDGAGLSFGETSIRWLLQMVGNNHLIINTTRAGDSL